MAGKQDSSAFGIEYGRHHWWGSAIQSYARMRLLLRKQGLEQHHLVHAAFFRKGPPSLRALVAYVPCLTLSMEEHRGGKYGVHTMKDGQPVGAGEEAFAGCGMDAFLHSKGIDVKAGSFSAGQVARALDCCIEYWDMVGLDHAAAALREFKSRVFEPALRAE